MIECMESCSHDEWKIQGKIDEIASYDVLANQTQIVKGYIISRMDLAGLNDDSNSIILSYGSIFLVKPYLKKYLKELNEPCFYLDGDDLFWGSCKHYYAFDRSWRKDLRSSSIIRDIAIKILNRKAR